MSSGNNILRRKQVQIEGKLRFGISDDGKMKGNISRRLLKEKEEIEKQLIDAREEYNSISQKISLEKERILNEANVEAKKIERKAYELGYEQGMKNGYEDGFKEAYSTNIDKAIEESKKIKEDGYTTLLQIRSETEEYIKENKKNILNISIAIAEQVLKEKFEDIDTMNRLLEKVIKEYSLKKDMVIKVNPTYINQLQISDIKNKLNLTQKIFVICDSDIENGNVEIETGNGKLTVGIDGVLEKIRAELL